MSLFFFVKKGNGLVLWNYISRDMYYKKGVI